jgi:hypothetical protein
MNEIELPFVDDDVLPSLLIAFSFEEDGFPSFTSAFGFLDLLLFSTVFSPETDTFLDFLSSDLSFGAMAANVKTIPLTNFHKSVSYNLSGVYIEPRPVFNAFTP